MGKVIVIGSGPAGLMSAITASDTNKVILIEKNPKLGKKLFITGKGRCNITNSKDIGEFFDYIPTNPHFLYSSLYSYTNLDTINFFEKQGIKLKSERGDRVFPESDKSSDILRGFTKEIHSKNIDVMLNTEFLEFITNDDKTKILSIKTSKGELKADHFILCTGGASYPQTGSDGAAFIHCKTVGHNIIDLKPSLIPIVCKESWTSEVQGLSLKNVELRIINDKKRVLYKNFGEMLFTNYGISGPLVLSSSNIVTKNILKNNLYASIDLKPALSAENLDKRIQKDFAKFINNDFKSSLVALLPSKLINVIIELSNIDPSKKVNLITKSERKKLCDLLKNLTLNISGVRPIAEAIVTSGGVDTLEIDPSTMKSKLIENLSFAGEVIDVDAFTGGFNIQIALSTGYLAGKSI
ncbi:MAG: NAD(P)/FAD-dependent oxidoreductase [Clostridium sp.]